jgi:hypothetical protein
VTRRTRDSCPLERFDRLDAERLARGRCVLHRPRCLEASSRIESSGDRDQSVLGAAAASGAFRGFLGPPAERRHWNLVTATPLQGRELIVSASGRDRSSPSVCAIGYCECCARDRHCGARYCVCYTSGQVVGVGWAGDVGVDPPPPHAAMKGIDANKTDLTVGDTTIRTDLT